MRFRLPDWDVEMPAPLVSYWAAWNETDLGRVREHLASAVTQDIDWNDPRDSITGIDELEAAIHRLRTSKPAYRFAIASEVDHHHNRYRYRWDMVSSGRTLMEGLDIATIDVSVGLICRVDGFFGNPTPLTGHQSGVPAGLKSDSLGDSD